jgi:mono/diheme cytochrome c family protein
MNRSFLLGAAVVALLTLGSSALPVAGEEDDGKALFDRKCAMCHGKDGVARSLAAGAGNFNDPAWQESRTLEVVIETITNGKGKMAKNEGKLTAEEIQAIAEYVKTL